MCARPFWAQRIARLLTRGRIVRVSWSDVRFADGHVALAKPASHYGIETVPRAPPSQGRAETIAPNARFDRPPL
jgi:hypothetical protein